MKLLVGISLIMTVAQTGFSQLNRTPLDGVAAQIGDYIILNSDIEAQVVQAKQAEMKITPEFRCNVLEGIMYQQLLVNQAILDSLVVTDQQVDAEMENRIRVIEDQIGGRDKWRNFTENPFLRSRRNFVKSSVNECLHRKWSVRSHKT